MPLTFDLGDGEKQSDLYVMTPEYKELLEKQAKEREEFRQKREDEDRYECHNELARDMYAMYQSFITAGFDETQAWKLLGACVRAMIKED